MHIFRMILFAGLAVFFTGCGGDDGNGGTQQAGPSAVAYGKAPATSAGKLHDRELTGRTCELLTPEAVAAVAGVDASSLEQRAVTSMCVYSWDGGQASLGMLSVEKTAEAARDRFDNTYRSMTGEEVAQTMGEINAGLDRKADAGDTDVDPQKARQVTGAMGSAFAGGLQFEDVPGVGDLARFETTKTEVKLGGNTFVAYANSLNVLAGNLKFKVSFNRDGEPRLYRDESVALAAAVIDKLPR